MRLISMKSVKQRQGQCALGVKNKLESHEDCKRIEKKQGMSKSLKLTEEFSHRDVEIKHVFWIVSVDVKSNDDEEV